MVFYKTYSHISSSQNTKQQSDSENGIETHKHKVETQFTLGHTDALPRLLALCILVKFSILACDKFRKIGHLGLELAQASVPPVEEDLVLAEERAPDPAGDKAGYKQQHNRYYLP
jgi:hypothetical protein